MQLSQAQFAEAVRAAGNAMGVPNHCTKRLVQKWETGEHSACRPDYLRVLQAVTGLSARELGFRVLYDLSGESIIEPGGTADAGMGTEATVPTMSVTMQDYPDDTVAASMERLRHALEHPSMVTAGTVEFVETATARLFNLEHHSPARLLAPTVDRHLAMVTSLLTAGRHAAVRRRLTITAGHTVMLAGWLAFDRGDLTSATRLWDNSISAAEGTADSDLLAASLIFQSYAALRSKDAATAWHFAHVASKRTPFDPRATAWANARVALYAAHLGEQGAASAAMNRSLEFGGGLRNPRPGDGTMPWLRCFDTSRLLSSTARTAALLKDPSAADYATRAVEALGPAKVKARAIVLAEAALAAAIVGELGLCLEWGGAAATLAREMNVSVAVDVLHEVLPVILPYSDTRSVRELLPQLSRLTRSGDLEI
jgi:hypothetical protein